MTKKKLMIDFIYKINDNIIIIDNPYKKMILLLNYLCLLEYIDEK